MKYRVDGCDGGGWRNGRGGAGAVWPGGWGPSGRKARGKPNVVVKKRFGQFFDAGEDADRVIWMSFEAEGGRGRLHHGAYVCVKVITGLKEEVGWLPGTLSGEVAGCGKRFDGPVWVGNRTKSFSGGISGYREDG